LKRPRHGLIAVAKIAKAFGIKGELVVQAMTDDAGRLVGLRRAFCGRTEDTADEVRVEQVSPGQRGVRVKLAGVDDRTRAEHMVGGFLFVDDAEALQPPAGRFYIHDIVGLRVIDREDRCIGAVKEVLKLPAHDVYVVDTGTQEIMIPAVKEFVKSIDVNEGTIRVQLIEGMLEEDAH